MAPSTVHSRRPIAALLTFDEIEDETVTVEIPEDLSTLTDAQLDELHDQSVDAFESLYDPEADGAPDAESVEAMRQLADGIDRIRGAQDERVQAAAQAREEAEALAARVRPADEDTDGDAEDDDAEAFADDAPADTDSDEDAPTLEAVEDAPASEDAPAEEPVRESVAASSGPTRVTVAGMRSRSRQRNQPRDTQPTGLSLVAAADLGQGMGTRLSLPDVAEAMQTKMRSINVQSMRNAARTGKRTVQSFAIGSVEKQFPKELILDEHADPDTILAAAVNEKRLEGGSLTAAGWCSPSQVMYELAEAAETTDGLFGLPEIQIDRGGIRHTLGPDFSSIFGEADLSWNFTEAEVEAGDYDGYGGGTKPCFFVECPEFVDDRLNAAGICIRAGLLQNRTYPETIQRLVSGSLVAHEFKQAGRKLGVIEAGSTAVSMPAGQLGALAPTLTAIELQVIDYRQRHRIADSRTLEAVFPRWVRGAIRSDLSRRLGVDMLSVTDAQINGWFAERGVAAQFVYELDDLTGEASARTVYPGSFKFLLYLAGTWVGGTQAIIDLEAVFDSALVEQNIYTQLFTEEGWLVAKRFHDSRVVTVPICPDGTTHGGVDIDCDGTAAG